MKINTLEKYIIYICLFLFPILFSSTFENIFDTPKLIVLFVGALIVLMLKLVNSIIKKGIEFNSSRLDLPVIFFIVVYLVSGFFAAPNVVDAFFIPGTATFAILSGIYYFLVNQLSKEDKENAITVLLTSAFLMATFQIVSFLGITKLVPQLMDIAKVNYFNPFGNILNSIVFLTAFVPYLLHKIVSKNDISEKILASIVATLFFVSIFTSIYLVTPNKQSSPTILNYKSGWSVAIDSLKLNPVLGIGPGNFSQAFNKFKPMEINLSRGWNLKFVRSSTTLLNTLTEAGIAGLVALVTLFIYSLKKINIKDPLYFSIVVLILGMVFLPLSEAIYPIFFLALALNSTTKENKLAFFSKKYAILFLTIPFMVILLAITYLAVRSTYAEILYVKSLKSISSDQGQDAYTFSTKAIALNKYSDRYHLLAAGINLGVAQNIAKNEEISDADRESISQLIQQSIVEAKAAVSVNTKKSTNWESLSKIYESISTFATGSTVFAIESLNQAIALEPTNPLLRIRLGGLYYADGKYENAIETFKLAVLAKPNLANSHYNLAIAYKANKQLDKAKEQLEIVLQLVEPDSNDYQTAKKEIENLSVPIPAKTDAPVIEPQIELPQE